MPYTHPTAFVYTIDCGHGWLHVPVASIQALDLGSRISGFSYQREGMAFLEEDLDMHLYLDALKKTGVKPSIHKHFIMYDYSIIRSYAPWNPHALAG